MTGEKRRFAMTGISENTYKKFAIKFKQLLRVSFIVSYK
jgi:hypothetical protein